MKKLFPTILAMIVAAFCLTLCFASSAAIWWLFLGICEVDLDMTHWTPFSRVVFGIFGLFTGFAFVKGFADSLKN